MRLKFIFSISFEKNFDIKISILKTDVRLHRCDKKILYENNNFQILKSYYFLISKKCIYLPSEILQSKINTTLYHHNMSFSSDEERKKFLKIFKMILIDFSKSDFLKTDLDKGEEKIAHINNFWYVY